MKKEDLKVILIAGSPNCGKSVLSYMLTITLCKQGTDHYLLRTAPDGEGNFFLEGDEKYVRELRIHNKHKYSDRYVEHMISVIKNRQVPLLVDIGGKPQGNQWDLIKMCTHYILLFQNEEQKIQWKDQLSQYPIQPLAEFRSSLIEEDAINQENPFLSGVITGLEREKTKRKTGDSFDKIITSLNKVIYVSKQDLENYHLQIPPANIFHEVKAYKNIFPSFDITQIPFWNPEDLERIRPQISNTEPVAVYGRGPVWLAAFIAGQTIEQPLYFFDMRYGWIKTPEIRLGNQKDLLLSISKPKPKVTLLEFKLESGILEPDNFQIPEIEPSEGVLISGKLPRWGFAALVRKLSQSFTWIGVNDANKSRFIVVFSKDKKVTKGSQLYLPS